MIFSYGVKQTVLYSELVAFYKLILSMPSVTLISFIVACNAYELYCPSVHCRRQAMLISYNKQIFDKC